MLPGYHEADFGSTKSFDDLMYFPTTLGMEAKTDSSLSPLDPEGLCVGHISLQI